MYEGINLKQMRIRTEQRTGAEPNDDPRKNKQILDTKERIDNKIN